MTEIERNKATTRQFFDCFVNQKYEEMSEILDDDLVYTMPGEFPLAGVTQGKDTYINRMIRRFKGNVDDCQMDLLNLTAEENRVAIQAKGFFKFKDGLFYPNTYHFLYIFNDQGQIKEMIEYMDSYHFNKVFNP